MRVIKFVWTNLVKNRMKGGAQSFEDWKPKQAEESKRHSAAA